MLAFFHRDLKDKKELMFHKAKFKIISCHLEYCIEFQTSNKKNPLTVTMK